MSELVDRRGFLKLVGAGASAAALGCAAEPTQHLVAPVESWGDAVPGVPRSFATTCRECPAGCGILVKVVDGRAIKIEGNPEHPVSRGGLCIRGQAALQGLYNPDRIRVPRRREGGRLQDCSWDQALELLARRLAAIRSAGRRDAVAWLGQLESGLHAGLSRWFLGALGSELHLLHEPLGHEPLRQASRERWGAAALPRYHLERARLVVSFGADFLETWLSNVEHARGLAALRQVDRPEGPGRLVTLSPRRNLSAANSDQWIPIRAGSEARVAEALRASVLRRLSGAPAQPEPAAAARDAGIEPVALERLAEELLAQQPCLVLGASMGGGGSDPVGLERTALDLNTILGAIGTTLVPELGTPYAVAATYREAIALQQRLLAGAVEILFLHQSNPLFSMPDRATWERAFDRAALVVSFATFLDESSARADLILPEPTPLESWNYVVPRDGVLGLVQPVVRALYQSRPAADVLLELCRRLELASRCEAASFGAEVRRYLRATESARSGGPVDLAAIQRRGGIFFEPPAPTLPAAAAPTEVANRAASDLAGAELALIVTPSLRHYDGRGANRPWLQEIPDPLSQVAWDSYLEIHPRTAQDLDIETGDLVRVESQHGRVELAAYLTEGMEPRAVAIALGQGHTEYGRYAKGRGVNPMALLSPQPDPDSGGIAWGATSVRLTKLALRRPLARTQLEDSQRGRELAVAIGLAELGALQARGGPPPTHHPQLYPPHPHPEHRWGMAIDLNACVGCNACVAACYAENNIPVVGRDHVAEGRTLAWIRIERYLEPPQPGAGLRFLPMLCQHCDNAPCESVCPVYATYHNPEGLNAQVYNRCVGTRYCSNNCPYKVRRFNWHTYSWPAPLHQQLHPEVTVRQKGVMEKCTFCVQRIQAGKDQARDQQRALRDGDVVPACAQSCPAQAIVFGDLKQPDSRVSRMAQDPRRYHVLGQLNTQPAITYLKRVIVDPQDQHGG